MNHIEPIQESLRQIAPQPCRLIILYMLSISKNPINTARIGDFILGEDYANYLTLQTAFCELTDEGFVEQDIRDNRTFLRITDAGREALGFFKGRLHEDTVLNVKNYLESLTLEIREEAALKAVTRKATEGGFMAELSVREGNRELIRLNILAPTEDMADDICQNWNKKYTDIYKYLTKELMCDPDP